MEIEISKNPENERIERKFKVISIETDFTSYAKIKGILYQFIEKEVGKELMKVTPIGMNPNGQYFELVADNTIILNTKNGEYLTQEQIDEMKSEGNDNNMMGEFDYIKNFNMEIISQLLQKPMHEITVLEVLSSIVQMSVEKQDRKGRFDI